HDVSDGTRAGPIAAADRASGVPAAGLWDGLSAFRDALSARKMGLVFRIAQRLGLARRLFRCGDGSLQTAPYPRSRRPHRDLGARRSRAQRTTAPIHHPVPGVRLLSRVMARPEPATAGHPGGTLGRFVLRPLHLWLACRAGGDMVLRWPCRLVAAILYRLADSRGARLSIVASRRA